MIRAFLLSLTTAVVLAVSNLAAWADLKIGIAAEPYPPFTTKDPSGQWVGWEVDVLKALCSEIGEKCDLVEIAWDGLIPALDARQIDVIWASMSITDKRRQAIDFSTMYYTTAPALMGARNGDMDVSPGHLKGKILGVQGGTVHQKYAETYFAPAGAEIKTYPTQDDANQDLAAGRLDYVQASAAALSGFLSTDQGKGCCESKGKLPYDAAILGEGVGAGIRKGDAALKAKLDAGLTTLAKNGTLAKITANYPGLDAFILLPTP